jgi:hypothetical protein
MVFKLIHWSLSPKCWKAIGKALATEAVTLQTFEVKASNLADLGNMLLLFTGSKTKGNKNFEGLIKNKSLEVLDLSDNDLNDEHGELIIEFLRVQAESRDLKIWELGLRQNQAQ